MSSYIRAYETGKISGVVSERDYVCKIALLGKTSKDTTVKGMFIRDALVFFFHYTNVFATQNSQHELMRNIQHDNRNLHKECQLNHRIAQ